MTEQRKGAFPLSTFEKIFAVLLGGITPLIIYNLIFREDIARLEHFGYGLCLLPLYILIIIFGALGGRIGAGAATRMLPRFRKMELTKGLVVVLGAVMGGVLGAILPTVFYHTTFD